MIRTLALLKYKSSKHVATETSKTKKVPSRVHSSRGLKIKNEPSKAKDLNPVETRICETDVKKSLKKEPSKSRNKN
jgi:hypothetical protein